MQLRTVAAGLCALGGLCGAPAQAADFVAIAQEVTIARPPEAVWKQVGGFCAIWVQMRAPCEIVSGKDGEVGAVRRVGRTEEVLVAQTAWSHTYAQPKSPIDYHGTIEVRPADGGKSSTLVYTLLYDAGPLETAEAKAADRQRRAALFKRVLETAKAAAEKP
ncbi:MAG TPA: SRPBCC family protein [Phenylobacterium sp.]